MSNGKGDKVRGTDPASRKRYADGWDRIFGRRNGKSRRDNLADDIGRMLKAIRAGKVKTIPHAEVVKALRLRKPRKKPRFRA